MTKAPSSSPINGGGPEVSRNSYQVFRVAGDRVRGLARYTERQRVMRKAPTEAEALLWMHLRNKQLDGLKFRRQHGIGLYIADLYCDQYKMIIEVDGSVHDGVNVQEYDNERTAYFESMEYCVIRFPNTMVLEQIDYVLQKIRTIITFRSPSIYGGARGGLI